MLGTSPTSSGTRGQRRRAGRAAKLPKMNASERSRYYREKYRQHEVTLEHSVTKLRRQVRDLEMFLHVRDELAYRNPYDSCESIVETIYEYFVRERRSGLQYDSSFHATTGSEANAAPQRRSVDPLSSRVSSPSLAPRSPLNLSIMQSMMRFWGNDSNYDIDIPSTFLFFDLLSVRVEGCVDAPVVVMRGTLHTKYTLTTIDRMFPHLIHCQDLLDVLLDKEVRYPCTYHFYFGSGGEYENKIVEADYVHGLQQVVGSLKHVMWLLNGSHRFIKRCDSLQDVMRGPPNMSLDFIIA